MTYFNNERAVLVQQIWDIYTGKIKIEDKGVCKFFRGEDPAHPGYFLCDSHKNSGSVVQVKGMKRCNILCCPNAQKIGSMVTKIMKERKESAQYSLDYAETVV